MGDNPNIFSPSGRLLQVEYAMRSIANGKPIIAIRTSSGIVIGGIKTIESHILQDLDEEDLEDEKEVLISDREIKRGKEREKEEEREKRQRRRRQKMQMRYKLMKLDQHILCGIIGVSSDCYRLVNAAQVSCQQYYRDYGESVPVVYIIDRICEVLQSFTQGQRRPFGVSFLIGGYDYYEQQYKLIKTDAAGNSGSWKACYLGQNQEQMTIELEKEIQRVLGKKETEIQKQTQTQTPTKHKEQFETQKREQSARNVKSTLSLTIDEACEIICNILQRYDKPSPPLPSTSSSSSPSSSPSLSSKNKDKKKEAEKKEREEKLQQNNRLREIEVGILQRRRGAKRKNKEIDKEKQKGKEKESVISEMNDLDTDIEIEFLSFNDIVKYCHSSTG